MKNINWIKFGLMAMVIGILSVVTAADVSAQGGIQSRANVEAVIRRMEEASNEFRNDFRNELDRSNLNNSQKNTYRRQVDAFEQATDRLRSNFDRDNNWQRSRSQVQNVIRSAQPLNNTMNSLPFRRNIERQWNQLRNNVNTLANAYGLPGIAGGSWNGGGNQPGGPGWGGGQAGAMRPPNWAQGTFYGVAPNGSQISLTISPNGSVTANVDGGMSYGVYSRGNVLNIAGATSRVTRQGNGILTTRRDNGERIAYSRTSGGNNPGWGGNNPGWGGDNNQVAPPAWARGRFVGRAPDGTQIVLMIDNNGSVSANVGGGMSYGSYTSGDFININGATSRVTSVNRGIRTTRTDNGEVITYRRQ
ncbi:hypothetical protein BH24ACI3_BH24ACI3_05910 [soil metagenome]